MDKRNGFTLLEVIITVTILAFISVFLAQAMQTALRSKKKIQGKVDRVSVLRDALSVMRDDIKHAFNYRDINVELYNEAQKEREKRAQTKKKPTTTSTAGTGDGAGGGTKPTAEPQTTQAGGAAKPFMPKEQKIYTQFQGQKDNLHFTSLSLRRVQADSSSSDQAEISYYLENCRGRLNKDHQSKCLWRRISPVIDQDLTDGGKAMVLLEDITAFELRYLGPGTDGEWRDDWMSGEGADGITQGKFPYAVEISLEVAKKDKDKDKQETPMSMTLVAPIRFPNNPVAAAAPTDTAEATDDGE